MIKQTNRQEYIKKERKKERLETFNDNNNNDNTYLANNCNTIQILINIDMSTIDIGNIGIRRTKSFNPSFVLFNSIMGKMMGK